MSEEIIMTMKSEDGETFEVPLSVARMFNTLCPEEDEPAECDREIPCRVEGPLLKKIIDYCTMYQEEKMAEIECQGKEKLEDIVTQQKYLDFINQFNDRNELLNLIQFANYAQMDPLLSLSVLKMSTDINNKSEDYIRTYFNIQKPS